MPNLLAFSRAPSQALRANSASSDASATVVGLRILLHRDLKEAFRERLPSFRPGRQHGEIFRVVKFAVHIEPEQADESLALLHDHGHRRCDHIGGVAADHEIDFVHVEKLGVDARERWPGSTDRRS